MILFLLSYLVSAYVFSGFICCLVSLRFNRFSNLLGWQRLLALLPSLAIVVFWPVWIIIETKKLSSPGSEERTPAYTNSDSRFLTLTQNSVKDDRSSLSRAFLAVASPLKPQQGASNVKSDRTR